LKELIERWKLIKMILWRIVWSLAAIKGSPLATLKMLLFVGVYVRPMRLRPMWPMYGNYIATLLGLAKEYRKLFPKHYSFSGIPP
jgi:hypothetical protein